MTNIVLFYRQTEKLHLCRAAYLFMVVYRDDHHILYMYKQKR